MILLGFVCNLHLREGGFNDIHGLEAARYEHNLYILSELDWQIITYQHFKHICLETDGLQENTPLLQSKNAKIEPQFPDVADFNHNTDKSKKKNDVIAKT